MSTDQPGDLIVSVYSVLAECFFGGGGEGGYSAATDYFLPSDLAIKQQSTILSPLHSESTRNLNNFKPSIVHIHTLIMWHQFLPIATVLLLYSQHSMSSLRCLTEELTTRFFRIRKNMSHRESSEL